MSRGVRDSIRHLGGFSFEDLGEQVVKNIARPVRAFRVTTDQEAAAEETEEIAPPEPTGIPTGPPADSTDLDVAMWETVKDSGDVEGFLHYLQRFPEGEFAEIARDRITALSQTPSELSKVAAPGLPSPALRSHASFPEPPWSSARRVRVLRKNTHQRPKFLVSNSHAPWLSAALPYFWSDFIGT